MNRPHIKSILIGVLSCVMLCALLCACGKGGDPILRESNKGGSDKVTLSFFGYKADAMNLTAIESAIQGFMDTNKNVIVTYEPIKGDDYWAAFDRRDATGSLDDVFMMHHDHVLSMSSEGKLADLSDLPGIENFTDEARAQFTSPDGGIYFLPTQNSTYNLYINTDLLEKHGQPVPTNWSEFQQVCDYFTSQGIVPIIANNRNALTTLILGKGLFDTYQLPEEELEVALQNFNENPELYAHELACGVEMVAEMIERGWIDAAEALKTGQTSDDLDLFVVGDRPFMLSGGWASTRVQAKNPAFSYGVYPYPILDDGSVVPVQVDTCISVNADSPNLEEAKAFVAHLIKPSVMWDYCDTLASYTPLKDGHMPSGSALAPSVDDLVNGRIVLRAEYRLDLPTEAALSAAANALFEGKNAAEAQAALLQTLQG